jgi:hypothetical protein
VRSLREENSRLRSETTTALFAKEDEMRGLRKEICSMRDDNAALTGCVAEATGLLEVKKEVTEATVNRIQKVRQRNDRICILKCKC